MGAFTCRKVDTLMDVVDTLQAFYCFLVYVNTVRKLCWLRDQLESRELPCACLHEDMTSVERLDTTRGIFEGRFRMILMTGFCAAETLPCHAHRVMIHYDLPRNEEALRSRHGTTYRVGPRKISIYFTTTDTVAAFEPLIREFAIEELPLNFPDNLQ